MLPGIVLLAITVGCLLVIIADLRSAARVPILQRDERALPPLPSVTVIIPARNEATRIGRCLDGLAAQGWSDLAVIVLDDQSTDGTAEVVGAFDDRLPRLQLLHGAGLPPGWAGKCWACWQAANATDTDWLLFLDADTSPQPGLIATLHGYATRERLDLLTLLPLQELQTFWERVLIPPFEGIIQATFPIDRVNDPRSSLALALGQCILVRRSAYMAVDGHRAVRDSVLEDVRLAQRMKQSGFALRVAGGPSLLRVRMYTNGREVAAGLHKNAVAGMGAGGGLRTTWGALKQALLAFGPAMLLAVGAIMAVKGASGAWWVLVCGGLLLVTTLCFWAVVARRLHKLSPMWAIWYPFGALCYFALAGWAALNVAAGRGVQWKGRRYKG